MRTVTVENNQIVVRVDGMPIRYGMSIIQKRIKELAVELETWRKKVLLVASVLVGHPASNANRWAVHRKGKAK
jgi:hypothetical protein